MEEDVMVWGHTVSLCNQWHFIFKSDFLGPLGEVSCLSTELLSGAAFPGESAFKILQSLERLPLARPFAPEEHLAMGKEQPPSPKVSATLPRRWQLPTLGTTPIQDETHFPSV